jgi:hypothetical protein
MAMLTSEIPEALNSGSTERIADAIRAAEITIFGLAKLDD